MAVWQKNSVSSKSQPVNVHRPRCVGNTGYVRFMYQMICPVLEGFHGPEPAWHAVARCVEDPGLLPVDRPGERVAPSPPLVRAQRVARLLGCERVVAGDTLYRCLDRLLAHKQDFCSFLRARWAALFEARFDVLLYDLTSTYFESDPPHPDKCCCSARMLGVDQRSKALIRFDSEGSNFDAEHLWPPPVDASDSLNGSERAVRCLHLSGLLMRCASLAPLAHMEIRRSGPYQHCELEGSLFGSWFSRSRLVDRLALARPPSCPHPRRRPALHLLRRRRGSR